MISMKGEKPYRFISTLNKSELKQYWAQKYQRK